MFPSDYPATLPPGGWMTFAEVYGPPYAGGAPIRIGAQNGSTAPAIILGNGSTVPWRMPALQRNKWYDFVVHEKLSHSSSTGFVELWVNSGSGWVKQKLSGTERLPLATLGTANGGGANYHKLAAYRMAGDVPSRDAVLRRSPHRNDLRRSSSAFVLKRRSMITGKIAPASWIDHAVDQDEFTGGRRLG